MSGKSDKIKIFVSCHKPTDFVKDEVFVPIQVGAALQKKEIPGCIRDDKGENISDKNPRFCELTTQYYAWKNVKAEYYGFFHYRRYLSFNESSELKDNVWGVIEENALSLKAIEYHKLNAEAARKVIEGYDIVLPNIVDITEMPTHTKSVREQYLSSGFLHSKDLDVMLGVLKEKYPDFVPFAERFLVGKKSRFCNMFIMRKEVFQEYSKWLFDILEECDKQIDYTDYSNEATRTPGHLAERLLNIYIAYLEDKGGYKIKELHSVIFKNTDSVNLKPAFEENNNAVVFSADDNYVPYLATTITSIVENSSDNNNYDLLVLNKDISVTNQQKLQRALKGKSNFSIRFINMNEYRENFAKLFLRGHFTVETWFRLMLPEILPEYDKVLYLDSDLIVRTDVADLYQEDVSNFLLAACHDADTAGLYLTRPKKREYMDKVLNIKKPYEYFQAGVILFNLRQFRETYTTEEMLRFAASYDWELLDQDVLNFFAQGKVKFVDMAWNVMFDLESKRIAEIISFAPKALFDEYMVARKNPKIVHFAGNVKPWEDTGADFAYEFWKYARKSECYEWLLERLYAKNAVKKTASFNVKKLAKKVLPENTKRHQLAVRLYHKLHR